MNNKGFTLIELIGVIVLLAVIATIATPIVQSSINTAREKTLKENKRVVVDAAKRYLIDEEGTDDDDNVFNKLKNEESEETEEDKITCIYISVKFLKTQGYLSSKQKIVDPTNNNNPLEGNVKITYDYDIDENESTDNYKKRYIYKYIDEPKENECYTLD